MHRPPFRTILNATSAAALLSLFCLQLFLHASQSVNYTPFSSSSNDVIDLPRNNNNNTHSSNTEAPPPNSNSTAITRNTKIAGIADINYAPIAHDWRRHLISLGYPSHQVVVVAADDATLAYFQQRNVTAVEPILHPQSSDWPVSNPSMKGQIRRRRIFATRWVYVLHQLRAGYSVLLTDVDNIFVRYLDTAELEKSGYDVYHAYCHNFPIRFLSMGFTVCGGMVWLRGNTDTNNNSEKKRDGPAVRYVLSILQQCQWSGLGLNHHAANNTTTTVHDNNYNSGSSQNAYHDFHNNNNIQPIIVPINAPAAQRDDQQVINSKFFSNTLRYAWDVRPDNSTFWKNEASGQSLAGTGHKFKFWNVDTAYRGEVNGHYDESSNDDGSHDSICPDKKKSWVAMPYNTITNVKNMNELESKRLRFKQWYEFCRNETFVI